MELTRFENEMLDGRHGPAKQRAMAGLVQLGRAFGAPAWSRSAMPISMPAWRSISRMSS
ncbi:MAG: aconitase X [Pseudomonadota bacterium]